MFGAALFSLGLLLWSLRKAFIEASAESRRGVLFALLLGNLMCGIVSITQQSSIWMTPSGWVTAGIFFILTLAYAVLLARPASYRHA
jgi:heme A synthase